jgi:hypothetical protein
LHNSSLPESQQQIMEMADRLYAGRVDPANVSRSVELLRQEGAGSYEIAWRLARALFFAGQQAAEPGVVTRLHARGVSAGRRAVRTAAASQLTDRVEGHFWLGVNLALLAQLETPARAALHALRARQALLKAIAIDASYHGAGPLRVLARLQHKLPRLLGGGIARACENYEHALRLAPANTVTRIYFAELLFEIGEIDRARAELEEVLNARLDPDWAFETERDQRLAREMLSRK